jgi:hypothetical protein
MKCALQILTGFLISSAVFSAIAQSNCDCTQIVGSCEASINVEPTGGPGSYGAKLRLTSTAPICSKISYYVDATPYFNILSRGNTDEDSLFGTKPVSRETISDVKCAVCKQVAAVRPAAPSQGDVPAGKGTLAGEWRGLENDRWQITWQLQGQGNSYHGTWHASDGSSTTMTAEMTGENTFRMTIIDAFKSAFVSQCTLDTPTQATCTARRFFRTLTTRMSKQ